MFQIKLSEPNACTLEQVRFLLVATLQVEPSLEMLANIHPRPNLALMLVGSYLNTMLYTLELVAVYLYFTSHRGKRDHRMIIFAVYFVLVADTVASFAVCANVFALCVLLWGDTSKAFVPHWSLIVWIVANALGPFVVQGFMLFRYWRLSTNYPVCIVIFCSMIVSLVLLFILAVETANMSLKDLRMVLVTLVLIVVTDLSITCALLWQLYKTRTHSQATQHLLKRISIITIITGAATCIFASCILIGTIVFPISLSYLPLLLGYSLGRVYSLTMLFTLLYREKIARDPWMHVNVVDLLPRRPTSHLETAVNPSFSSMTFSHWQDEPETTQNPDIDLRRSSIGAPSHPSTLDFPPPAKIVT